VFLEDGAQADYEVARAVVLPVPYERTVSWGRGTARGPQAILDASEQLEIYNERTGAEPFRCGIWTSPVLEVPADGAAMTREVERRVGELLDDGKWVAMLGGEHAITPGAVRAAAARYPGLGVVQLDAHADLRDSYHGDRFSHASAMARCLEIAPVLALGIRSYTRDESERMRSGTLDHRIVHAWEMDGEDRIDAALARVAGRPVYLTFDVDYFDPSVVPATGTPEPGGGTWYPTLRLLERLFRDSPVVACDVVELAPVPGLHHADYAAARLVYELIGLGCGGPASLASPRGRT
jgi:agmatinase